MGTFLVQPENFESLSPKGQDQVAEKINEALKMGLLISPRGEYLDGFGNVLVSVPTMTPKEYKQYRLYGGGWEFISGVTWICERLDLENQVGQIDSGERGAA